MNNTPDSRLSDSGFPMKIGDAEYTASMFSDKDWGDINEFIRSEYLSNATKAAINLPEELKAELLKVALSNVINVGWGTEEGNNIIYALDGKGILRVGYQMIRKRNPRVSFAKFEEEAKKDLSLSINTIMNTYSYLQPVRSEDMDESGGSSAENTKSETVQS